MQHRIATAGWSLPGGAEHAIASWGYVSRLLAELTGPTLFGDAGEAIEFAPGTEVVGFGDRGDHTAARRTGAPVAFVASMTGAAVVDLAPGTAFRGATEVRAFLDQHESMCFASSSDAVRFRRAGDGTLFRARVDRACFT